MFRIGDFSRLTRVSERMLRYYDELGIFKPVQVDRFTGYRFYAAEQIGALNRIVALRDMGFSVAEIAKAMDPHADAALLTEMLTQKKCEVADEIAAESRRLQSIDAMLTQMMKKESTHMNFEVKLITVPAYKVVSLRDTIPAYNQEGILWQRLGAFMEKERIPGNGLSFAMYHDDGYKDDSVDVEVVMCVDALRGDKEGFTFRTIEPVETMASLMVVGPYENLAPAYEELGKWLEQNGYEIVGGTRQVTHKGPWNEQNPAQYCTELQIPVKK